MILSEKKWQQSKDLQTQEKTCVEKYAVTVRKPKTLYFANLFEQIHREEQKHYDSLGQVLNGTVPPCDCVMIVTASEYSPKATYDMKSLRDKRMTASSQQTVSVQRSWSLLNTMDVFVCGEPSVRKLLA